MSTTAPHVEDLLLDFSYGELSEKDARAVEAHVHACAQCKAQLDEIQGVRKVMSKLPAQPAPDAGLESLLAYAQQAARRVQAGPPPKKTWWRTLLVPVSGLAAIAAVGVIAHEVMKDAPTADQVVNQALFEKHKAEAPAPVQTTAAAEAKGGEAQEQPVLREPPPPPPPAADALVQTKEDAPARKPMKAEPKPAPEGRSAERAKKAPADDDFDMAFGGGLARGDVAPAAPPPKTADKVSSVAKAEKKKAEEAKDFGFTGAEVQGGVVGGVATGTAGPAPSASAPRSQPMAAREEPAPAPAEEGEAQAESAPVAQNTRAATRDTRTADTARATDESAQAALRLSSQAQAAHARGQVSEEARLLRQAVALAPSDRAVLGNLLLRLCDAEFALGNDDAAQRACDRAAREFPGTSTAVAAKRRVLDAQQKRARMMLDQEKAASQPAKAAPAATESQ